MKYPLLASVLLNIALIVYAVVSLPTLKRADGAARVVAISPYTSAEEIKQTGFNFIDQMRLTNMAEMGAMRWILVFDRDGQMEFQPLVEVSTIQNKGGDSMIYIFEQPNR